MNKYLQPDTPTTETLLFKTSSIRMTEPIRTNIPKTYRLSSLRETGGKEGGTRKKKKKSRNPQLFQSKILFNENEGIERKMSQHISGYGKPFQGQTGVPGDEGLFPPGWAR